MNKLQNAVIEQLGFDSLDEDCMTVLEDVSSHGADAGFSGFIYYDDTVKFFNDNRDLILQHLINTANELGGSSIDMVKGFRCLNGDFDHEAEQVLMGIECDDHIVKNALAWFALESVAFELANQ